MNGLWISLGRLGAVITAFPRRAWERVPERRRRHSHAARPAYSKDARDRRRLRFAMEMDRLDEIAAEAFDGYIVRKDLVRKFARQYPVPTYVCEFLLGRYCASVDEGEIQEGLQIVERQLRDRAVRSGEEELFKARAKETGSVKIIDLISARLDARTDSYLATLPSLQLKDVSIDGRLVNDNERMLTGGFYAEVDL